MLMKNHLISSARRQECETTATTATCCAAWEGCAVLLFAATKASDRRRHGDDLNIRAKIVQWKLITSSSTHISIIHIPLRSRNRARCSRAISHVRNMYLLADDASTPPLLLWTSAHKPLVNVYSVVNYVISKPVFAVRWCALFEIQHIV